MEDKRTKVKRDRFLRVFPRRKNEIIRAIDSIIKCANRYNYSFNISEVNDAFIEIEKRLMDARFAFGNGINFPEKDTDKAEKRLKK
ncbi:MAG: hypothetical protein DRP46_14220 [Candidatus Zixiibacteriota bacterium]|nr:MAG: hypothetical protein DRP46_14220 [candidate division Zixibacteria bacterium]